MTSTNILPSIGPPPPGFKRPFVPDNLKPDSLRSDNLRPDITQLPDTGQGSKSETAPSRHSEVLSQERAGRSVALSASSAVAVQVRESVTKQQAKPESAQQPSGEEDKAGLNELTDEEKAEVKRLKERDREVRAHETAHANAGRGYTGSPSYEYVRGPDGVQYAVGGHVQIDVSEVPDDPRATIAKMEVVRQAALAPAQPSGQDRAVAAAAAAKMREAEADLAKEKTEETQEQHEKEGLGNQTGVYGAPASENAQNALLPASEKPKEVSLDLLV